MNLAPSLLGLILAALSVHAAISEAELKENTAKGLRLISLNDDVDPVWKGEDEVLEFIKKSTSFFDVTHVYESNFVPANVKVDATVVTYPKPSHQDAVNEIIKTIKLSNMQSYLGNLTSFNNRYYKSTTGAAATEWIVKTAGDIAERYPTSKATVTVFKHQWIQSSIIAHIPGKRSGPVTIIGAHMDSINENDMMNGRAPGADDDGSGSVNLMEAFRALLASDFKPSTPVEFHWYSAEEAGLLGSQSIAKHYKDAGVRVKAMMQLDMTAYVKPGTEPVVGLIPDHVNAGLTTFLGSVIDTYSSLGWKISAECGYACSDHASWDRYGYPSCFPFESLFEDSNPLIHTPSDTTQVDGFSWTHTLEYTKIAVAFAYELAI